MAGNSSDLADAVVPRERPAVEERGARGLGVVFGREAEVAELADFLAAGRRMSVALVLDGEAGIGKTTLFEATVAEAREQGFAVFSCRPSRARRRSRSRRSPIS